MTPKEKADFLVAQYCKFNRADDTTSPKESAKACSLFSVLEILKALFDAGCRPGYEAIDYWENVKTEIENL